MLLFYLFYLKEKEMKKEETVSEMNSNLKGQKWHVSKKKIAENKNKYCINDHKSHDILIIP